MARGAVARVYAQALLELGRDRGLFPALLEEMRSLRTLARTDRHFRLLFESPRVSREEKLRFLEAAFGDRLTAPALHFLRVLVRKGREDRLATIVEALEEKIDEIENRARVEVASAVPLAREIRERLVTTLEERLRRRVTLVERVDPTILGGLRILAGDRLLDGTVRTQLRRLRLRALDSRASQGPAERTTP